MCFLELQEKSYCLAKICETNFERLFRLVPDLAEMAEFSVARADGKPTLYLKLLEHSPYTVTVELSHCFGKGFEFMLEPAVKIRIYLDARVVEVLSDQARPKVHEALRRGSQAREILDYKWTLNYFLSQWLDHCLASDYCFGFTCTGRETYIEQA